MLDVPLGFRTAVAVPGDMVFTLERNSPGLHRRKNRQFGEVVPAVDSDASSVVCGVEAECLGHRHQRGALQPAWGRLVHHYWVYGEYVSHSSLLGTFMAKLSEFMNRACAECQCPNMVWTRVPSPVRRRVIRHCHPSGLTHRTATTTLRPGKLHGLWRLLRHLMTPSFPLCRCHRCPSGLCAHFHQTGVAVATAFRHTRYHSDTGTCTAAIPVIPIVTGVTVIDPLL